MTGRMSRMVIDDIKSNDRAVVAIDVDGELVDQIRTWAAAQTNFDELSKRITIIDPAAGDNSYSYNPLAVPHNGDLYSAASATVIGFKAIGHGSPQWTQQATEVLRDAAALLMANGKPITDLPVLLSDIDYRDLLLEKVNRIKAERPDYSTLLESWTQYKRIAQTNQWVEWVEPILDRVTPSMMDPRLRLLLAPAENSISLTDCILNRNVVLVRIAQSDFKQNALLIGSLLVVGLQQATSALRATNSQVAVALYLNRINDLIDSEMIQALADENSSYDVSLIATTRS